MTVVFSVANNKRYIYIKSGSTWNTFVILLIKRAQRFPPLALGFLLLMSGRTAAFLQ